MSNQDMEDWSHYASPNAELEAMLPAISAFKLITPETTAKSLRIRGANQPPTPLWPNVQETDIKIPVRDGTQNPARVYFSTTETLDGNPLLVMIYGGGYVLGTIQGEETNCRVWASKFGGIAVAISYKLAPEHPWPGPHEDIYDAVKWISMNYKELGADPSKGFVLGGTSAGATTAITISHLFRDEGVSPPLTGLFLACPAPCIVSSIPENYKAKEKSWEQNKDSPIFNREASLFLAEQVKADPNDKLRSPLLYPTHAYLPPTYFAIAGSDPWRDSGLIYEEVLRMEYGIMTRLDVFNGLPHTFWGMFPNNKFSEEFREKAVEGLGWLRGVV